MQKNIEVVLTTKDGQSTFTLPLEGQIKNGVKITCGDLSLDLKVYSPESSIAQTRPDTDLFADIPVYKPKESSKTIVYAVPPDTKAEPEVSFILDKIFENLKRTTKSTKILTALIEAKGEINLPTLLEKTELTIGDISSWFAQTGKKIKGIKNVRRGVYLLDTSEFTQT